MYYYSNILKHLNHYKYNDIPNVVISHLTIES